MSLARFPPLAISSPAVLAALPQALAVLDEKLCVTWANAAFLELFQVGADVFGRPLEDLWGGKTEQPEVWKLLEDVGADALRAVELEAERVADWVGDVRFSPSFLPPFQRSLAT